MVIGIPQAGYYWQYYFLWQSVLAALGFEFRESPLTDREILNRGAKRAASEFCLPVKAYFGHLDWLDQDDNIDKILIPDFDIKRRDDVHRAVCPNWLGLPDLAKTILPPDKILKFKYDPCNLGGRPAYLGPRRITSAIWQKTAADFTKHQRSLKPSRSGGKTIALVGHAYILADPFLNLGIVAKLRDYGFNTVNSLAPLPGIKKELGLSPMHWQNANEETAALHYFARQENVKGIIMLAPFLCGPGFLMDEIVIKKLAGQKPILNLTFNENLSDTHLRSRLEAFLEILS